MKRTNNPSPHGVRWIEYIAHRLRMSGNGVAAYTKRYYARLKFSKYIDVNSAMDKMAMKIAPKGKRCVVYLGAADVAADSPIKIKKHVRAPGGRRLLKSLQKRDNVTILKVDEYYTSQTCAKCFGRFDVATKSHHFKVCRNCRYSDRMLVPTTITTVSRRSKVRITHEIDENRRTIPRTVVWQRDIVAAKCILYKGTFCLSIVVNSN